jgi:hypothetical protein
MTIHAKCDTMKTANGLTAGDLEVWVEDANTDAEKMLAAFIGNSIRKGVEELTVLAECLFTPPKSENEVLK